MGWARRRAGQCRQMLFEFAPDLRVVLVDEDGTVRSRHVLSDLLPHGFGPSSLRRPE